MLPTFHEVERLPRSFTFGAGSHEPRKTQLRLVVKLNPSGIGYPPAFNEEFQISSFPPPELLGAIREKK